uniref:AAA_11 domain-containing protein n=1 Tax=Caenorhabditis japonica TaxID=281687 RepID=A0A8R1DNT8_CAEJA
MSSDKSNPPDVVMAEAEESVKEMSGKPGGDSNPFVEEAVQLGLRAQLAPAADGALSEDSITERDVEKEDKALLDECNPLAGIADALDAAEDENPAKRAAEELTIKQIQKGRNMTIAAISAPAVEMVRPLVEDRQMPTQFLYKIDPDIDAIVAVIVKNIGSYMLASPAKREYCGTDRGDLFYLAINERQQFMPEDWSPVQLPVNKDTQAFFAAKECAVFRRTLEFSTPICAAVDAKQRGHKLPIVVYGQTTLAWMKPNQIKSQKEKYLAADVFVPMVLPGQLIRNIKKGEATKTVLELTAKVQNIWSLPPLITKITPIAPEKQRQLEMAPMSFSHKAPHEDAAYSQAYAATFGLYGCIALASRNEDLRHFVADVVSVIVRRRQSFGPKGTAISAELPDGSSLRLSVLTAEQVLRRVRVGARLLSPAVSFDSITQVTIHQRPSDRGDLARQAPKLKNIPIVNKGNNAMQALAVIRGEQPLPPLQPLHGNPEEDLFTADLTLSDKQVQITRTLAQNEFTALAISCGFGTGKTTTLCISVLNRMNTIRDTSVMVGMSNSAVTSAVAAMRHIDKTGKCKIVRIITATNRNQLESEHHTDDDFPIIWKEFFHKLVTGFDNSSKPLDDDIVDATHYLKQTAEITVKSLKRRDLRVEVSTGAPKKKLTQLFFQLFEPDLVLGTIASIRSAYTNTGMQQFSDEVGLLLIDEASQLPRYAFMTVCHTFPQARPVLLGDVNQLPPFADNELPEQLHRYAIGSVLRDATSFNRFPQLPLMTVHRCPAPITQML